MEVICLQDEAFYALLDEVIERISKQRPATEDRWIASDEAMRKLRITSKTTLQKLRDEGKIRFSQPEKKMILYDTRSIDEFLEKHAKGTF